MDQKQRIEQIKNILEDDYDQGVSSGYSKWHKYSSAWYNFFCHVSNSVSNNIRFISDDLKNFLNDYQIQINTHLLDKKYKIVGDAEEYDNRIIDMWSDIYGYLLAVSLIEKKYDSSFLQLTNLRIHLTCDNYSEQIKPKLSFWLNDYSYFVDINFYDFTSKHLEPISEFCNFGTKTNPGLASFIWCKLMRAYVDFNKYDTHPPEYLPNLIKLSNLFKDKWNMPHSLEASINITEALGINHMEYCTSINTPLSTISLEL